MRLARARRSLLLASPASAAAAPFGELPFRPVTGSATCLRATGAPGELMRWIRGGVEVCRRAGRARAGRHGPARDGGGCPAVAGHRQRRRGARGDRRAGVHVALREPGGAWGAPVDARGQRGVRARGAINARGDAIVLWTEYRPDCSARVRAARRPAGGWLGPAETSRRAAQVRCRGRRHRRRRDVRARERRRGRTPDLGAERCALPARAPARCEPVAHGRERDRGGGATGACWSPSAGR